jgi:hypothetical protein
MRVLQWFFSMAVACTSLFQPISAAAAESGRTIYVSPSTNEEPFRSYYLAFAKRMEERGAADFPKSKGKSVYGSALAAVTIRSTGALEKVEILRASSPLMSQHTSAMLKRVGVFEPFSDELRTKASRVVLVSQFNYLPSE